MKKLNLVTLFMLLALKAILELSYIYFVAPVYAYEGFYEEYDTGKFVFSYFLSFVIMLITVIYIPNQKKASQIIIYIILLFLYLPITSLYWMQNLNTMFVFSISISFLVMIVLTLLFPRVHVATLKRKDSKFTLAFIVIVMSLMVYGLLIFSGGLSRINLNIGNVYETRAAYKANNNFILRYCLSWQAHVVNLILLSLALYKKKYLYTFMLLGMQVFLFSMTNFKSHLFAPFIIFGFYIFQKTKWKNYFLLIMSTGVAILVSISLIGYSLSKDSIMLPSVFIRRLFYVPAQLHYQYFEFFENKDKFYLSHSIFEAFIENPYGNENPVTYMAYAYFSKDFAPNVGFWGDAYINFGFAGVIFTGVFIGFIMLLVDACSSKIPLFLTMSILVIPFMSIINSALLTTLLTHGILFSIVMLWLVNGLYEGSTRIVH